MPITKCSASKATPDKGINYILDPEKVIAKGNQGFFSMANDPEKLAKQMMTTMHLWHKGYDPKERKYYHAKVAFSPTDRPENGGKLTKELANRYAAQYAAKTWPGREVVWAVQDHGTSIHIHFIVAACERDTGIKLDARNAEYRQWKDAAQDLAREYGLSTLDWRKATKEKRAREKQEDLPVKETFAEQGLASRNKTVWKDELRQIIDQAATSCSTMNEFREQLKAKGVTLTRNTEASISYRLEGHKACRGDTLGADYTAAAIRDALAHNREPAAVRAGNIDDLISNAAARSAGAAVSLERRQMARDLGRVAGVTRAEIDAMCDRAPKASWAEKQEIWGECSVARDDFWREWNIQNEAIKKELDEAYKRRRRAKQHEWALDPRNKRSSLLGIIVALIFLCKNDDLMVEEIKINQLKRQQEQLRQEAAAFKAKSGKAAEKLREKGLTIDEYMANVKDLQKTADQIRRRNYQMLTPEERVEYGRKADERAEQRKTKPKKSHEAER